MEKLLTRFIEALEAIAKSGKRIAEFCDRVDLKIMEEITDAPKPGRKASDAPAAKPKAAAPARKAPAAKPKAPAAKPKAAAAKPKAAAAKQ